MSACSIPIALSATTDDIWEAHKNTIYDLYIVKKKGLQGRRGLIHEMRTRYGFTAT
jgi:hypothetical protein